LRGVLREDHRGPEAKETRRSRALRPVVAEAAPRGFSAVRKNA
jgi:hypothetical protein